MKGDDFAREKAKIFPNVMNVFKALCDGRIAFHFADAVRQDSGRGALWKVGERQEASW